MVLLGVNIQCLKARLTELCFHLASLRPHIVLLQETWLDESVEEISIPEYKVISRRDRAKTENRGGVLTLARADFNRLVHIENSVDEEVPGTIFMWSQKSSWLGICTDLVLLCTTASKVFKQNC